MAVTQKIRTKINKFKDGTTFKYDDLSIEPNEFNAAAKAIERLVEKQKIKRISTGIFYKPKQSAFGELKPNEIELLKPYLFQNGKRIAYITGISLYNRMGLTTQLPKKIKIASRDKQIRIQTDTIIASPVKSYVDVSEKNYYLLEILDALKDFKNIPDVDKKQAIKIISNTINKLDDSEKKRLIKCALAYPPRARAFLGALLENSNNSSNLNLLKNSLNPLSEYDFGLNKINLPTVEKWNLK